MAHHSNEQHIQTTDLIKQAQSGDLDAFNALVRLHQNRIYNTAYRIMGDSASAEDMTQEAFITAYRKIDSYKGGNFGAWLNRIVTNTCYDELRRLQRRPADYIEEMAGSDYDDGAPIPDDSLSPEQQTQNAELTRALQECIQSLKPNQRIVLVMSDVQGFAYQEIADNIDASLGTVKSRLSRARLAVRRCLQAFEELLPPEFRLSSE